MLKPDHLANDNLSKFLPDIGDYLNGDRLSEHHCIVDYKRGGVKGPNLVNEPERIFICNQL